jgi:hypothetical protein
MVGLDSGVFEGGEDVVLFEERIVLKDFRVTGAGAK